MAGLEDSCAHSSRIDTLHFDCQVQQVGKTVVLTAQGLTLNSSGAYFEKEILHWIPSKKFQDAQGTHDALIVLLHCRFFIDEIHS